MRRLVRIVAYGLVTLVVLAIGVLGIAWWRTDVALARVYTLAEVKLDVRGDPAQVERGRHLAVTRGCTDCHGDDLAGAVVIDAGPVGIFVSANLTPAGAGKGMDANLFEHAVRHGVGRDGRPLRFMPATDFAGMDDDDVAALYAYVRSVPPASRELPETRIGPLGRVLYLFDRVPILLTAEVVDHAAASAPRAAPVAAATAEYGRYLAMGCTGCHGERFAGGRIPGAPPDLPIAANLTPDATGLAAWSEADFVRAIREGKRPDGSDIDPFMPWKSLGQMTDTELRALYAYLHALPPLPSGAG